MKKEVGIPNIFYFYIHSKIWEKSKGRTIPKKEIKGYLAEWRIPKNLRPLILKELVLLGLLKENRRHIVEVEKSNFNEEDLHKMCKKLNIY